MRTIRFCLLIMLLSSLFQPLFAQTTSERFGKNRIQYKKFNWRNLSTQNFDIYHYDNGARLAQFAIRYLETEFNNITDVIGYPPQFKTKIFIYNSISDLQQSNVGIDDLKAIIGGQTDFFKSQVEIPFTGSEVDFKKELRRGVAQMLIREMMFGGSLRDMIQNSYLGKFSEWFLLGASSYVAEGWSLEMEEHLRDLVKHKKLRKPHLLSGRDAILVGQSIWNFIAEKYGKNNIAQILNHARYLRKERSSISSTLGVGYIRFIQEWQKYYKLMADETLAQLEEFPKETIKLRKNRAGNKSYNEMKVNPAGTWVAYSENKAGKFRVITHNLQTGKRKVLLRGGYYGLSQRYDEDIPTLSWRDNGQLGVMYMRKGETKLSIFDLKGKRKYEQTWFYFNHVTGFDFSDDGQMLVISADRKGEHDFKTGQNDLYVYDLENKANTLKQITDDWYDDMNPVFLPKSKTAIAFSSNRLGDSLTLGLLHDRGNYNVEVSDFDLFIYNPEKSKKVLERLTNSPQRDVMPVFQDENNLLYLSEETGIRQLKSIDIKTHQSQNVTAFQQGLRTFDYVGVGKGIVHTTTQKGRILPMHLPTLDLNANKTIRYQTYRGRILQERSLNGNNPVAKVIVPIGFTDTTATRKAKKEVFEKDEVDTDNYTFNNDLLKDQNKVPEKNVLPSNTLTSTDPLLLAAKKAKQQDLKVLGPYDYQPRFRTENATTAVNWDPILGFYVILNTLASDLLENHKFRGGFVSFLNFKSSFFFGQYQYLAKRYDLSVRFDRNAFNFRGETNTWQYTQNKLSTAINYPFSNLSRVSVSPFYQNTIHEQAFGQNIGVSTQNLLPNTVHYGGVKVEWVFDNTTINGQNMMRGSRAKVVWEENVGLRTNNGFKEQRGVKEGLTQSDMSFRKIVFDARHYQPIHRDLTLALRLSGGTFAGRSAKNFLLGGMDNWLFNKIDNIEKTPFAQNVDVDNSDLLFTEFVTNLRGFNYAKMIGQTYIVANAELRFPIFKYLFGQRVNSNFLKNFQLVGFYDVGSAWTGLSPFENATAPIRIIESNSIRASVNDFKSPWLMSYGAGLRTVMFGYYIKLDMAWGVEDFIRNEKPKLHLTLGYDF